MAARKPVVINSGRFQVLQAGDILDAPQSGGDQIILTNANVGALVIGTPVYVSGNDQIDKSKADASGTTKPIGLVNTTSIAPAGSGPVLINGVLTATTGQWDAVVTGGSGGLVAGTIYYLSSATAGMLTSTAPSAAGTYVTQIGIALSTTELFVDVKAEILL